MEQISIAILGGTGDLGGGLAIRWATAGHRVIIGSRDAQKAQAAAQATADIATQRGQTNPRVSGAGNADAAQGADIVVLTVPFSHQKPTLEEIKSVLAGKILIDVTVPLVPPKVMRVQLPPEGSAGQIAQTLLGEGVRVVSAFHNVSADLLKAEAPLECDVLVFGDDKAARQTVIDLANGAGMRALHGGSIANSASAEALTSVLIFLNKQYGGHAGIRITGIGSQA